jgi:hypothetical protein
MRVPPIPVILALAVGSSIPVHGRVMLLLPIHVPRTIFVLIKVVVILVALVIDVMAVVLVIITISIVVAVLGEQISGEKQRSTHRQN